MRRAVALYRSPAYSPLQHLTNDRAILDATADELSRSGWDVVPAGERDVAAGRLPPAELYLNMCQGPVAAGRLHELLPPEAVCLNTPRAVLTCHRHRLVGRLQAAGVPFPRTILVSTAGAESLDPPLHAVTDNGYPIWVKRGDVHAETPDDVVAVPAARVPETIAEFATRGIPRVALQEHVPGPVVKFYGVGGGHFFHWYAADGDPTIAVDPGRLRDLAVRAAATLGLEVFGGDAVIPRPDAPVLIDMNDWPSFAPVRAAAAAALAHHAHQRATNGRSMCSIR
jgi:hypothetical protein